MASQYEEDKGYGPPDTDKIHNNIVNSLSEGYSPQEIIDVLKTSQNPEHQSWYNNYRSKRQEQEINDSVPVNAGNNASVSANSETPFITKLHDYSPAELALGAGGTIGAIYVGKKLIDAGLSRVFPSQENILKKQGLEALNRQNDISERKLNLDNNIDPYTVHKIELEKQAFEAEQRRKDEIHKAKLESMGVKSTAPVESVSPALQGSTVELPNTATTGIQTTPTATAESTLGMLPPVTHNAQGVPAPFAVPAQINPSSNPTGAIGVGNMPEGGSPAPFSTQPATPAQKVIEQTTGTEPEPPVSNQSAIGEVSANPVESGSEANPLHEPGSDVGKTQLQASAESTENKPPKLEKEIKGAVKPVISRRTKEQTKVFEEEMPQNKFYNQIANRLAGTENLKEHPHITQQFDKAWEDVFHNVLGGKMEKSQGGSPAKINEIESHINANAEKYPDLVKYMNEAKQYAKGNVNPKEGGFSHIGAMLGMLGAGGLGAYMLHRYGNPFEESMKKANEAMGDVTGTQDLLKANKAEELSPAMRALFTKASNPVYRKEINEQLVTEKNPERINELKRELEKAK